MGKGGEINGKCKWRGVGYYVITGAWQSKLKSLPVHALKQDPTRLVGCPPSAIDLWDPTFPSSPTAVATGNRRQVALLFLHVLLQYTAPYRFVIPSAAPAPLNDGAEDEGCRAPAAPHVRSPYSTSPPSVAPTPLGPGAVAGPGAEDVVMCLDLAAVPRYLGGVMAEPCRP